MRPNIFDIATKELNQDAFIAWILQFADSKYKATDELLNQCGKTFVYQKKAMKSKYLRGFFC